MAINSRTKLIEYCLRRLGNPVIDINIDGLVTNPDGTENSENPYTGSNDSQIQYQRSVRRHSCGLFRQNLEAARGSN